MPEPRSRSITGTLADRAAAPGESETRRPCIRCGIPVKAHTRTGACRDCLTYVQKWQETP